MKSILIIVGLFLLVLVSTGCFGESLESLKGKELPHGAKFIREGDLGTKGLGVYEQFAVILVPSKLTDEQLREISFFGLKNMKRTAKNENSIAYLIFVNDSSPYVWYGAVIATTCQNRKQSTFGAYGAYLEAYPNVYGVFELVGRHKLRDDLSKEFIGYEYELSLNKGHYDYKNSKLLYCEEGECRLKDTYQQDRHVITYFCEALCHLPCVNETTQVVNRTAVEQTDFFIYERGEIEK